MDFRRNILAVQRVIVTGRGQCHGHCTVLIQFGQ